MLKRKTNKKGDNPMFFTYPPPNPYGFNPYGQPQTMTIDELRRMQRDLRDWEKELKGEEKKEKKDKKPSMFTKIEIFTLLALGWPVVFTLYIIMFENMLQHLKSILN